MLLSDEHQNSMRSFNFSISSFPVGLNLKGGAQMSCVVAALSMHLYSAFEPHPKRYCVSNAET